jgi:lactoylglutathione lyase
MNWDHVGLKCADIGKSLHFYCDLLGFELQEKLEILGRTFLFVGNGSTRIELEQGAPSDTQINPRFQTGQNHLAFLVPDVKALVDRLKSGGVPVVLEPFSTRPGRLVAFVEDPDGVFIQLIELLNENPS